MVDLQRVHALVLDPRRFGTVEERAAYVDELEARYLDIETVMNRLMALPTWDDRAAEWHDAQLQLVTAVVHQIGTLRGEYDDARAWGDRALELGGQGSALRRADLMLHLSEVHRVTGRTQRAAELSWQAADLLHLLQLSEEEVEALAPVSCDAFFRLGAQAYWEGWPDEARQLLAHATEHGGDSVPHMWSLVNLALILTDESDHAAVLAHEDAAMEMATRLGDRMALVAIRNNRACTLRHLGRLEESYAEFASVLPRILVDDIPDSVLTGCEDLACVLFDMGRDRDGALLMGAAEAERESAGVPRMAFQETTVAQSAGPARERLGAEWGQLQARGAELGVLATVATALAPASGPEGYLSS